MTKAAEEFAARYARMSAVERSFVIGDILRKQWYARIYNPQLVDRLTEKGVPVARESQIPAWLLGKDSVRTHIWSAGRGAGKTKAIATYYAIECLTRPGIRAAILAPGFRESEQTDVLGKSGVKTIIDSFDKSLIHRWDGLKHILYFANGSRIDAYSSEYPKSMRGPEFHIAWIDEVADLANPIQCFRKILEPAVRLDDDGHPSRILITGTPAATELIADLYKKVDEFPDRYAWTTMATRDNISNLDTATVEQLYAESDGTDFQKAELDGILILESPNALLTNTDLARVKIDTDDKRHCSPAGADEVILAVDANHSDDAKSDECGIIVMGKKGIRAHVFADASTGGGPKAWGDRIVDALVAYPEIDDLVVEEEGLVIEVVESLLEKRAEDIGRPIKIKKMKHGNKSKKVRADPVAVQYKLMRVLHDPCNRVAEWSDLSALEWQWRSWDPKAKGKARKSPDRLDADVYGATYLLLRGREPDHFYRPR